MTTAELRREFHFWRRWLKIGSGAVRLRRRPPRDGSCWMEAQWDRGTAGSVSTVFYSPDLLAKSGRFVARCVIHELIHVMHRPYTDIIDGYADENALFRTTHRAKLTAAEESVVDALAWRIARGAER